MAGTNYGGGGWQDGCGIRWFGGMGERWKIDGRRRKVAGRACPAPTGWRKGERVLAGRCAGVGWFRAISVGGGVLDVPRRGQDPSLRCGRLAGGGARPRPRWWTVGGGAGERGRAGHARPLRGGAKKKAGAGINFQRVSLSPNLYTSVTCFPLM